jgi:hypothetical protein
MAKGDRPDTTAPVSEAAEISQKIGDLARRISSGQSKTNDFSDISDLIRRRAGMMQPIDRKKAATR